MVARKTQLRGGAVKRYTIGAWMQEGEVEGEVVCACLDKRFSWLGNGRLSVRPCLIRKRKRK